MGSLSAFLNPVKTENKEVIISDRFQENGKPVPFVIRPVTQAENEELMKNHRKVDKQGVEIFNRIKYNQELVASAVVEPPLDNAELQKCYGVLGASNLLSAMLYAGEYATLLEEIQKLSGFDTDINDDIEEAKNE